MIFLKVSWWLSNWLATMPTDMNLLNTHCWSCTNIGCSSVCAGVTMRLWIINKIVDHTKFASTTPVSLHFLIGLKHIHIKIPLDLHLDWKVHIHWINTNHSFLDWIFIGLCYWIFLIFNLLNLLVKKCQVYTIPIPWILICACLFWYMISSNCGFWTSIVLVTIKLLFGTHLIFCDWGMLLKPQSSGWRNLHKLLFSRSEDVELMLLHL